MWWEIVRKNIGFEGMENITQKRINECIKHRRYSNDLAKEVWERCEANSKVIGYKKVVVPYLLEAFLFEGKRLLLDENFAEMHEKIIHSIIEHVRKNRRK